MSNLLLGGNHRGGLAIVNTLPVATARLYEPHWVLADPKEQRAAQLARIVEHRFDRVQPQPLQMTVQNALLSSREDDTVVLALDSVAGTKQALQARRPSQPATFQLVGRSPGGSTGVRTAIHGTIMPGDRTTERAALLLLETLEGMTEEASSRVLTSPDPVTAAVLRPMREMASRLTALHLAEMHREPWDLSSGGPLSVIFGTTVYPLIAVQGAPQEKHSQRQARALDAAGRLPARQFVARGPLGHFAMVAVVIPQDRQIHFMTVAQAATGKRRIRGITTFAPLPPTPEPSHIDSAVFTD